MFHTFNDNLHCCCYCYWIVPLRNELGTFHKTNAIFKYGKRAYICAQQFNCEFI